MSTEDSRGISSLETLRNSDRWRSHYIKHSGSSYQKEKRYREGLVSAIKCSSLKVTHVTSVHSPLVGTSHLAASNHRGPGSVILPCSRSAENQKCLANSTNDDHKVPGLGSQLRCAWLSRKKTTLCFRLRSSLSSFAIKYGAWTGSVMIPTGGSREETVA